MTQDEETFAPGIRITWTRVVLTDAVRWIEINGSGVGPGPGVWEGGNP
jgi:hypothetical protein